MTGISPYLGGHIYRGAENLVLRKSGGFGARDGNHGGGAEPPHQNFPYC